MVEEGLGAELSPIQTRQRLWKTNDYLRISSCRVMCFVCTMGCLTLANRVVSSIRSLFIRRLTTRSIVVMITFWEKICGKTIRKFTLGIFLVDNSMELIPFPPRLLVSCSGMIRNGGLRGNTEDDCISSKLLLRNCKWQMRYKKDI